MVNPAANRDGRGLLGCLFPLALIGVAVYLGVQFGRPWFASQQFRDEMHSTAKFATTLSDQAIRERIVARADSLGLPVEARRNLRITRLTNPERIVIESGYSVEIDLPVIGPKTISFRPHAEEPL